MAQDPRERNKTCPKCPDSPTMTKTDRVFIIPQLGDKGEAISSHLGASVQVYECPNCHLVELYHISI
jgi:hypothetical protein